MRNFKCKISKFLERGTTPPAPHSLVAFGHSLSPPLSRNPGSATGLIIMRYDSGHQRVCGWGAANSDRWGYINCDRPQYLGLDVKRDGLVRIALKSMTRRSKRRRNGNYRCFSWTRLNEFYALLRWTVTCRSNPNIVECTPLFGASATLLINVDVEANKRNNGQNT